MKTESEPWNALPPAATWRGWAPVDDNHDDAGRIPVMAAQGTSDGPTVLIVGGVHGDEYEGPRAIHLFFNRLQPQRLAGKVIGIPVANLSAWQARSRVNPRDSVDLNRAFGRSGETDDTGRIAGFIFGTFVRHADVVVDLHSGGLRMEHLPLIGWYRGGSNQAEQLARRFHPSMHPWLVPDTPGVLSYEAQRAGKIALGAEWHGGGALDNAGSEAMAAGLFRVLGAMCMYASEAIEPDQRAPISGDYQTTSTAGLFIPAVQLGQTVKKRQSIGVLTDELGQVTSTVTAFRGGTVAALPHLAYVQAGERIAYIG